MLTINLRWFSLWLIVMLIDEAVMLLVSEADSM